jgi:hypothetical protein
MSEVRHIKVSPGRSRGAVAPATSRGQRHRAKSPDSGLPVGLVECWKLRVASTSRLPGDWTASFAEDVITVFALAVRCGSYPDTLGYSEEFERVVHAWRPELKS